jgi:hypothetical protein
VSPKPAAPVAKPQAPPAPPVAPTSPPTAAATAAATSVSTPASSTAEDEIEVLDELEANLSADLPEELPELPALEPADGELAQAEPEAEIELERSALETDGPSTAEGLDRESLEITGGYTATPEPGAAREDGLEIEGLDGAADEPVPLESRDELFDRSRSADLSPHPTSDVAVDLDVDVDLER